MGCPPDTDRLSFREMRPSDLDFMASLLGDSRVMAFYPRPYRRDEARAWIDWNRRLYQERGFGLWLLTLRETGESLGDCGVTPQDAGGIEEIEVGYHIRPELQGRGYATEAAAAVQDFAVAELGLSRIVAIIDPANAPSQRVAERIGLRPERTFEQAGRVLRLYSEGPGS